MVLTEVESAGTIEAGERAGPASGSPGATTDYSNGVEDRPEPAWVGRPDRRPITLGRVIAWVVATVVMLALSVAAVFYGLGPLTHQRDQRETMAAYKLAINHAAAETNGLGGVAVATQPPLTGATVGILQIPVLGLQQTVTEGVGPTQTVSGPGHVPGTAGLGQPGNSAVVGRRAGFGGPFAELSQLRRGDQIEVATTEGRSLYLVRRVRTVTMITGAAASTTGAAALSSTSAPATTSTAAASRKGATAATKGASPNTLTVTGGSRPATAPAVVTVNKLYGPTPDDQLTLVTSASSAPWNTDRAVVVTARMLGRPFAPTPQQSRSPSQTGTGGDPGSLPLLILALLALGATIVGAAALYRRASLRSAYLLTTAPLIVFTILGAEAAGRLFPAWL